MNRKPNRTNRIPGAFTLSNVEGFTLIEMLAVLVIISVFIVVALPAFNNLSRSAALPGALRQVANEVSLARQYAITHRVQTELMVNTNLAAVSISNLTAGVQIDKWNYLPMGTIVFLDPNSVSCVSTVVFTQTGATTNLNGVTICVREGSYETVGLTNAYFGINSNVGTISINNLLGRILVQRP
jgi:prepilin-type N-terminal cleavage/methylation domain-containing protein